MISAEKLTCAAVVTTCGKLKRSGNLE